MCVFVPRYKKKSRQSRHLRSEEVNHWNKIQNRQITVIIWFSIYTHACIQSQLSVSQSETVNIFSEFDLFCAYSFALCELESNFLSFVFYFDFVFQQQNANFAPFSVVFSNYFKRCAHLCVFVFGLLWILIVIKTKRAMCDLLAIDARYCTLTTQSDPIQMRFSVFEQVPIAHIFATIIDAHTHTQHSIR